jgi:uncharacterized protein YecT (DUF1311 family)
MRLTAGVGALLLASIWGGSGVHAEMSMGPGVLRYLEPCAGTVTNDQVKDCLAQQYRRVDEEINAVWPHVLKLIDSSSQMPPEARKQWHDNILTAQRAWVQYKDAECTGAAPFKFYQSAQAEIEHLGCLVRLTALRLGELKEYLSYRPMTMQTPVQR